MNPASAPDRRRADSPWSWRVGVLLGVEVRVHGTMVLLLAWIAAAYLIGGRDGLELLHGLALTAALFTIVLLHEMGHALTARRFGIATRDITLLPIGGVSRLERMPERPGQELLVSLAGPAVNLVVAGVIAAIMALLQLPAEPRELFGVGSPLLAQLLWMNVSLAVFNLLPAFPTDGGRALRALLAMRLPRARATAIATTVGRWMAVLLAVVGAIYNPLLLFIAIFLYVGAQREASGSSLMAALAGLPVARGMMTEVRSLRSGDPLSRAASLLIAGAPPAFIVDDGAGVVGVVTHDDLVAGLEKRGPDASIAAIMQTRLETMDASDPLDRAVERALSGTPILVAHDGQLAGLLTPDRVGELALLLRALARRP